MITLRIRHAEKLREDDPDFETISIVIDAPLLDVNGQTVAQLNAAFNRDGRLLFEALRGHLPGGTLRELEKLLFYHFLVRSG